MTNKEILKKKIIYRSSHRGTKEMDLLLGNFVKSNINLLNYEELIQLEVILSIEDQVLQKWLFSKRSLNPVLNSNVSEMIKKFKL